MTAFALAYARAA